MATRWGRNRRRDTARICSSGPARSNGGLDSGINTDAGIDTDAGVVVGSSAAATPSSRGRLTVASHQLGHAELGPLFRLAAAPHRLSPCPPSRCFVQYVEVGGAPAAPSGRFHIQPVQLLQNHTLPQCPRA